MIQTDVVTGVGGGELDGDFDGLDEGALDGENDGLDEGELDGEYDGLDEGALVGVLIDYIIFIQIVTNCQGSFKSVSTQ